MSTLTIPNNIANGDALDGSIVDANFDEIASYVNDKVIVKDGGVAMTGALTLSGAPSADLHASTKKYVDDQFPIATADITDGAVTEAKLASNAVTTGKIAAGAVGTSDIADAAVTNAKLGTDIPVATQRVGCSYTATLAVASGQTNTTAVQFSTLVADTHSFKTDSDTITIPAGHGGVYAISVSVNSSGAAAGASEQRLNLSASGSDVAAILTGEGEGVVTLVRPLAAGSTIEASIRYSTGASSNTYNLRTDVYKVSA